MTSIKSKINQLNDILIKNNAPILNYFNDGLRREIIISKFVENKIPLDESLIALFEWHNGINIPQTGILSSKIEIIETGIFYSLDFLLEKREVLKSENLMKDWESYTPFMGSTEDDIFLLKNETGEVYYYSPAINIYGDYAFSSIEATLDYVINCFQFGRFTINPKEGLVINYDKFVDFLS